MKMHGFVRTEN
jgi:hypothetical protein